MTTTLRIFFQEAVGLLVDIEVVFESFHRLRFFGGVLSSYSVLGFKFPLAKKPLGSHETGITRRCKMLNPVGFRILANHKR